MPKGKKGNNTTAFTEYKVSDGYVFYKRLEQSTGHWKNLCNRAKAELSTVPDLSTKNWGEIAATLTSIGNAEKAKEIALIQKYLPDIPINKIQTWVDLIKWINVLIQGKNNYSNILTVLKNAIAHAKETHSKERSPLISSYFMTYFNNHIQEKTNNFVKYVRDNCIDADSEDWEKAFKKMINETIDAAMQDLEKVQEKYADQDTVWAELLTFYNSNPIVQADLHNAIQTQVNFDDLRSLAMKQTNQPKKGFKKLNKADVVETTTLSEIHNRTLGGYIWEVMANMFAGAHLIIEEGRNNIGIKNLDSNMLKTDSVLLFLGESSMNADTILQDMNNSLLGGASLTETRDKLQQFYDKNLANLNDSFIVYVSSKSYAMTDSFRGFTGVSNAPISQAKEILEKVDIDPGKCETFIKKLYSTVPGGLAEGENTPLLNELKRSLIEALAYLLFDDWTQMGEAEAGDPQSIHLFNFDGIYMPLSALLLNLARACNNMKTGDSTALYVNVSFNRPEILYPSPIKGIKTVQEMDKYWEEQRAYMKNFTFSVHVMASFKSLISTQADVNLKI